MSDQHCFCQELLALYSGFYRLLWLPSQLTSTINDSHQLGESYSRIRRLYHVSIRSYKRSERESWLDVAERSGHLEKVYAIVSAELIYTDE